MVILAAALVARLEVGVLGRSLAWCKRVTMRTKETAAQCDFSAGEKLVVMICDAGCVFVSVKIFPVAVVEPGTVRVVGRNV